MQLATDHDIEIFLEQEKYFKITLSGKKRKRIKFIVVNEIRLVTCTYNRFYES